MFSYWRSETSTTSTVKLKEAHPNNNNNLNLKHSETMLLECERVKPDVSSVDPDFLRERISEARRNATAPVQGAGHGVGPTGSDSQEPLFAKTLKEDFGELKFPFRVRTPYLA
jgi:hypothetical protein